MHITKGAADAEPPMESCQVSVPGMTPEYKALGYKGKAVWASHPPSPAMQLHDETQTLWVNEKAQYYTVQEHKQKCLI